MVWPLSLPSWLATVTRRLTVPVALGVGSVHAVRACGARTAQPFVRTRGCLRYISTMLPRQRDCQQ